ncbi:MAG: flippase [Candidatus Margulisiibacteriota bacterium]|jgi:O-antigen/teichoic acid export membrane protein
MQLSSKIAYNTIIQLVGKVISTVLGLVALAMMARYLGQAGFGSYTTVINFVSFFAIIADLGLTLVTVQMISRPDVDENKVLNNLFGLRLVSVILFLVLAPIVAIFLPYSLSIKIGIIIAALSFLFPALNQIIIGLFQKKLRMDKSVIAETLSRIILVIGIYFSIKFSRGLNGILWVTVISAAFNFLISYLLATKYYLLKPTFDFRLWREVILKSWPLAVTIVLNLLYLKTDTLILSFIKSPADVGLYGAAYRIIDVLTTLPFMFAGIILPVLTLAWFENKKDYFAAVLQKSFDLMVMFSLPIIAGTLVLARPLIVLVAGNDFADSGLILKILIFAIAAIFLGCMFSHAVIAIGQQKKMIGAYVFVSLSAIILYLIFIPTFSYYGAAAITIYSEVTIAIFAAYVVWKYTKFIPSFKIMGKTIIASTIMGLGLYFTPSNFYYSWLGLVISGLASLLLYFISLYLFKGFTKNDLKILLNKKL